MANTLRFKRGLVSGIPTAALGEPLFTTDTFDLYIGNGTGNTRFQKYIASGTTSQLLRGDGSLLTMPIVLTSPSNGQVLKYDGTNWVNSSDAGVTGSGANGQVTFWNSASTITGSNNLFWNAANNRLGINTNAPSYTADIRSAAGTVLSLSGGSSTNQGAALYITNSAFTSTLTAFGDSANILGGTPDASATIFTGSSIPLHFYINGGQAARISTSRNFIINNSTTDNGLRLQVTGDGYFSGSVRIGTTTGSSELVARATTSGYDKNIIIWERDDALVQGTLGYGKNSQNNIYLGSTTNHPLVFQTNNTERMRLDASGNLGLGVTPSAWSLASLSAMQIQNGGFYGYSVNEVGVTSNSYYNSGWKYINSSFATQYSTFNGSHRWYTAPSGTAGNAITFTQAMTLNADGRLLLGSTSDNGLRFQVTGDGYFSGGVGIGSSGLTNTSLRISKNITGSVASFAINNEGVVQSDVTANAINYRSVMRTAAAAFTLNTYEHFAATETTLGAGSALTTQTAFSVGALTQGTNIFAFRSEIASGTGRWNLYMNGTAANYLNGNLGVGFTGYAWPAATKAIDLGTVGGFSTDNNYVAISNNWYWSGSQNLYKISDFATQYVQQDGLHIWTNAPSGTAGTSATFTERMRLDASGNLGLGVTPSAWSTSSTYRALDISNSFGLLGGGGSADLYFNLFFNASSQFIYKANGSASAYSLASGQHRWYNVASGTAGAVATLTQAMTLDASGNLLVGSTTAGGSTTPVNISLGSAFGTNTAGSTANLKLRLYDDGVNTNHYGFGVSSNLMEISFPSSIAFFNGASASRTERMRINASGRVLIGSSSDSGETFQLTGTMRVSGASTLNGFTTITNTGGGSFTSQLRLQNSTSSQTLISFENSLNGYAFGLNTTGTQRFVFINGGLSEIASISGTGAATFSSSVTATAFIPTDTTAPTNGLYLPASNTLGFATASGEKMRLNATGNLGLGTTSPTDSGSFGRALDVSGVNGAALYLRYSTDPTVQYGYIGYDRTGLGILINTNNALPITFNTNNTTRLTIASTGAATFSSSVTVNGDAIFGSQVKLKTYSDVSSSGIFDGATLGANNFFYWNAGRAFFGTNGAERMRLDSSGNLGIAMTPSYKLDVTGEARVSNAIAIGTTPDTNKPFKILKNINGTVGINFENTSTGASAFSAIQMGTDVSGGTAFANLVYSSSGVTAAGVYQPSGTSLINTGSGGLNFLSVSQPIRFFTSTGNGTERVRIKNEGQVHFVPLAAAPTTNVQAGDVYYDSTLAKLRCYDGIQWQDLF